MENKSGCDSDNECCLPKSEVKHTPTPWKYDLGRGANPRFHIQTEAGYQIASTTELARHSQAKEENEAREANATFIVRAVNSHEAFLKALRTAGKTLISLRHKEKLDPHDRELIGLTISVIAQAEGK